MRDAGVTNTVVRAGIVRDALVADCRADDVACRMPHLPRRGRSGAGVPLVGSGASPAVIGMSPLLCVR